MLVRKQEKYNILIWSNAVCPKRVHSLGQVCAPGNHYAFGGGFSGLPSFWGCASGGTNMFLHHPIGKANKAEQNSTPVKTASDYVHQVAVRACWMYVLWLRSCRPLLPIARSGHVGHKTNLFFFLTLDAHSDIYFTLSQTHVRVPTGMESLSLQIDKVMEYESFATSHGIL